MCCDGNEAGCCLSSLNLGRISVLAGAQSSIYAATCPSSELPEGHGASRFGGSFGLGVPTVVFNTTQKKDTSRMC